MGGGSDRRRWAYLGSYTEEGGRGITVAEVDAATGALTARYSTAEPADPSFLALAPDGGVLYAVSETDDGSAAALSLADPARPRPLGAPVPVRGDAPTHLALAAGRLFTANYGSGSVSVLPVGDGGTLGPPSEVFAHRGSGPVTDRQAGPHAHAVVPDPSGRWLLSADLGTDSVWTYALDPATGAPAPHGQSVLPAGSGPRHLAFHPRGEHAYVVNELEPTVTVCRWDAVSGRLEPTGGTRVVPTGVRMTTYPSAPVVSADGRFLWVANRGHDSIATLALDASGERPELRGTVACGGRWPRHLAAGPGDRLLYAANQRSGDVTWFTVDEDSGLPRRAGSIDVPAASCVLLA
ncbi:lactonase family protein [Streptomyces sp. NPDC049577]|uniref:lactonase family protein n=1 Tax=Streptomyces sp. NPDC049577 TaxID=3155153 RepID=UPI0034246FCC